VALGDREVEGRGEAPRQDPYRKRKGMIEPVFANPSSTAASTASNAAAAPPSGQNGD
jgi:hypothetical protein